MSTDGQSLHVTYLHGPDWDVERGPFSLMNTTEKLLGGKSSDFSLDSR
jgi:hypothetical protein